MYDFMRRSRGAISMMVIIIMLPMMTLSGLFLDLARTKLAQEVAVSSADLALNTVLSDYDKDLKDYYGLLASCQNPSEVIEVSKKFFVDSMVSAGVNNDDAQAYADKVISAFGADAEIHDMLRISVEGDVTITPMANGAMNNPALLKEGISEFMKYRAPVNGVVELFSKISDSDVQEQLKDSSDEAKLIDAREDFYKAEKDLIKQAQKAYKAINAYEEFKAHTGDLVSSEAFLEKFSQFLMNPMKNSPNTKGADNGFESKVEEDFTKIYQYAHELLAMNLINTHNANETLSISLLYRSYINNPGAVNTYSAENPANIKKIEGCLKSFNSALQNYYYRRSLLGTAWNKVGGLQNGDWPIQYWVLLTKTCANEYYNYRSAANTLWKEGNKLYNALEYAEEDAFKNQRMGYLSNGYLTMPTPDKLGQVATEDVKNVLWNAYQSGIYSEISGSGCDAFRSINSQIGKVNTNTNAGRMKISTVKEIFNIAVEMKKFYDDAAKAAELLETAKKEVSALSGKIDTYKKKFDAWKKAANNPNLNNSSVATGKNGDRAQIEELEKNGGLGDLNKNSVAQLEKRLGNVYTVFNTLAKDMKNIKYNGTSIMDVYDFSAFCRASKLDKNKVHRNEQERRNYANQNFSFTIGKQIQTIVIRNGTTGDPFVNADYYMITDPYHSDLTKTELALYTWLQNKFGKPQIGPSCSEKEHGYAVSDEDSANDADEKLNKKGDNEAAEVDTSESTKGKNFSEWEGATLPSKGDTAPEEKKLTAKLADAGKFASDLFSNFPDTMVNVAENTRDDLYAVDYVFSMFTHDTFDKEGCYAHLNDQQKKDITASNADSLYAGVKGQWNRDTKAMTLTLNPRNPQYNWCYGGEVEYMLYGNKTNALNKTTAYANIYLIRYALDLKPVFDLYWKDPFLEALAQALQAFAYIPANLTKTVACLAITAAEAGMDIAYLKQGIPVAIYKTKKEELFCNYRSVFTGGSKESDATTGITLQYSDYLKIFLFVKLKSDENIVYVRMADVIQANMSLATNDFKYELAKANVFYSLKATVMIEPMWSRLLAIDDLGDLSTSKGWRSFTMTTTGGY